MFKILAPLGKDYDVEKLIKLGADEFYFGIDFTKALNKRDNEKAQINIKQANNYLSLRKKYPNIRFFIALNEAPIEWTEIQVKEKLSKLLDLISPDAFIVRDLLVIKTLLSINPDIKLHISSLAQVWNNSALEFYKDMLGGSFERFIFSRDVSGTEQKYIIKKNPQLEFEIFALNEWCWNVDGLCSSLHGTGRKEGVPFICHREYAYPWNENLKKLIHGRTSCKVCNFWKFKNIDNIISLKIVGRGAPFEQIERNIKYLKSILSFIDLSDDFEEYQGFCQGSLSKINKANWCSVCELNKFKY